MNAVDERRPEDHDDFGKRTLPLSHVEIGVTLALLIVIGIYLRDAWALPASMNPSDVGAGRFPLIAGTATAVGLLALLVQALQRIMRGTDDRLAVIGRPIWVCVGMGLLVLQALVFMRLGAIPVLFGSALLLMLACGERRPMHLIITPIVLTAAIYAVFTYALGIQLP